MCTSPFLLLYLLDQLNTPEKMSTLSPVHLVTQLSCRSDDECSGIPGSLAVVGGGGGGGIGYGKCGGGGGMEGGDAENASKLVLATYTHSEEEARLSSTTGRSFQRGQNFGKG